METTRLEREKIIPIVKEISGQYTFPLTVRQIYYRLISDPYNYLDGKGSLYGNLDACLVRMREEGDLSWTKIADRSTEIIGGDDFNDGEPDGYIKSKLDGLRDIGQDYSLPIWETQQKYTEVWIEKDALRTLIDQAIGGYKVVIYAGGKWTSMTKIMEGLKRFNSYEDKDKSILYLGDHDPSGKEMDRNLQRKLDLYNRRFFGQEDRIIVERIALEIEQVQEFNLVPRPTKKGDTRTPKYVAEFGDRCWEIDAIPPDELQKIIRKAVVSKIDIDIWNERVKEIEDNKDYIGGEMEKIMEKFEEREQ